MPHDDPFADLTLASGYDAIVARMEAIRVRASEGDPAGLAAISLYYVGFLNRIIAEGEALTPDDPALARIRKERDMIQRVFGDHIAEYVPGTRH